MYSLLLPRTCIVILASAAICSLASADEKQPPVTAAAFSPNGTAVMLGSQAGVNILSWPIDGIPVGEPLDTKLQNVHDVSFSPDGRSLLLAGGTPTTHGSFELWDWPKRSLRMRVSVGDDVIYHVAWMQDSKRFVTVSADSRCRVIDAETGKPALVYEGHSRAVLAVDLIEDSALAITGGVDQTLRLWDIENGNVLRTLNNHLDTIHDVFAVPGMGAPHPIVATLGADKTVRLWQPTIGRMMRFARLEAEPLCGVASTDGTRLYIGCQDGHVRTIAVDKMNVVSDRVTKLETIYGIMLTPDKQQVFVSGVGGIDWFTIDEE